MVQLLDLQNIPRSDRRKLEGEKFKDVREELDCLWNMCIKLNTIIENVPDGIYITDGDANATRINPAFERISGLKREDMLGVNHRKLEKEKVVSRSSALMVIEQNQPVTIIHEYTGARQSGKLGLLELASKGTIFLDEVGELPLNVQVKLLRALETRSIVHVGGDKPIPVDIRVISATNRDLLAMVRDGTFREDLYYRLRVVPIHIPPLRERKDDIIPLISKFLKQYNEKYGLHKELSQMAYRVLFQYDWPGNVRELKNVIERIIVMSDGDLITAEDLPMHKNRMLTICGVEEKESLKDKLERAEYMYMADAYERWGSIRKAAKQLQMSAPTFVRKWHLYQERYSF